MKIFLLYILLPSLLIAQEFDCNPTCNYSTETDQILTVVFGGTCSITIDITKTECNDGSVIVKINNILSYDYINCGNPGPGKVMMQAIHALIESNPLGLGSGSHKYVYPSCWKFTSESMNNVTPCNEIFCCEIEIVYDNNCNRILPTRMSWEGVKSCFDPPTTIFGHCQNACIDTDYELEIDYRDLNGNN